LTNLSLAGLKLSRASARDLIAAVHEFDLLQSLDLSRNNLDEARPPKPQTLNPKP
jgi:hypothetical protein